MTPGRKCQTPNPQNAQSSTLHFNGLVFFHYFNVVCCCFQLSSVTVSCFLSILVTSGCLSVFCHERNKFWAVNTRFAHQDTTTRHQYSIVMPAATGTIGSVAWGDQQMQYNFETSPSLGKDKDIRGFTV